MTCLAQRAARKWEVLSTSGCPCTGRGRPWKHWLLVRTFTKPFSFWPVPKTVQNHIANGSHKGAPRGIRIFLHPLGNGHFQGYHFPRFLEHNDKPNGFFYMKSNEKFASALLRASSKFNPRLINCQGLFLCGGSQLTLLRLLGDRKGKQIPFQTAFWDITKIFYKTLAPSISFLGPWVFNLPFLADDISWSRSWVPSTGPEYSTVSQTLWVHTGAKEEQRRCVR